MYMIEQAAAVRGNTEHRDITSYLSLINISFMFVAFITDKRTNRKYDYHHLS